MFPEYTSELINIAGLDGCREITLDPPGAFVVHVVVSNGVEVCCPADGIGSTRDARQRGGSLVRCG